MLEAQNTLVSIINPPVLTYLIVIVISRANLKKVLLEVGMLTLIAESCHVCLVGTIPLYERAV